MIEDPVAPEVTSPTSDGTTAPPRSTCLSPDGDTNSEARSASSESRPPINVPALTTPKVKKLRSSKDKGSTATGFAPSDINDGRERYDWETKYPPDALKDISFERKYLFGLLYGVPVLMVLIWSKWFWGEMGLGSAKYSILARFSYAWLGGMLGGTVFDLKWLYHSVAKGMWHQDRAPWRHFTPHVSGALAFAFFTLISSSLIKIFDQTAFESSVSVVAISFLIGYFSDSAVAKLTELAETLFGTTRKARERISDEAKEGQSSLGAPPVTQSSVTKQRTGKS
jgi:hypothetical protein